MSEACELTVARRLTGSEPLSYRLLPDGGLCVIAADGRKLWFTPQEAAAASNQLTIGSDQTAVSKNPTPSGFATSPKYVQLKIAGEDYFGARI